jgi:hypothetical protein
LLTIVLVVWIVLTGAFGSGFGGFGGPSPADYLTPALAAFEAAPAVHDTGTFTKDGHEYRVDVARDRSGNSQGTVTLDGTRAQFRNTASRQYVLSDRAFWTSRANDPRLAPYLDGRWVLDFVPVVELSTPNLARAFALLDRVQPGHSFNKKGVATKVNGVPAVPLSDADGVIYVSADRPYRFLRLVSSSRFRTADGVTGTSIDLDYPDGLAVEAPSPVVDTNDPATLPARYNSTANSFKFSSNCSSGGSGCTLTVTVINDRGPQVGDPTADFHLQKPDGSSLGSCTAPIRAVGHNQTEDVSCTVSGSEWTAFTYVGGRFEGSVNLHNPFYDA